MLEDGLEGGGCDGALAVRLSAWLAERVRAPARVVSLTTPGHGGLSADTLVARAEWGTGAHRVVVRRAPVAEHALFPEPALTPQAVLLSWLAREGSVPVAEVIGVEEDPAVLGRPFLVTAFVEGRIPPDRPGLHFAGWVKDDLDARARSRLLGNALATLAAIHRVTPPAEVGDLLGGTAGDALGREIERGRQYLDWASAGEPPEALLAVHERLAASRPSPSHAGLVWGDARLGNLVFGPDLEVRAVLDWEMATVGPPLLDLGWYLFLEHVALSFTPQLPGFPDPGGIAAAYAEIAGPVEDLDWYVRWGGFRTVCIQLRLAARRGRVPHEALARDPTFAVLRALDGG